MHCINDTKSLNNPNGTNAVEHDCSKGIPTFLIQFLFSRHWRSYLSPVSHIVFPGVAMLVVPYFKLYDWPVPAYHFACTSFMASPRERRRLYPQEVGNHSKVSLKNFHLFRQMLEGTRNSQKAQDVLDRSRILLVSILFRGVSVNL